MKKKAKSTFVVGTGRCGTHFIYSLIKHSKEVLAYHEQDSLSDTFLRYVTFYNLPIDTSGCWARKGAIVKKAFDSGKHYFESSAYLSLNIIELNQRFDSKFIFLVRHPKDVINSYFNKGWYENPVVRKNPELPPSVQPGLMLSHHHFGRIVAFGEEGKNWGQLTRVGRIAWYWNHINSQIIKAFGQLPKSQFIKLRLEDFDFPAYLDVCKFLQLDPVLSERKFNRVAASKPNSGSEKRYIQNGQKKKLLNFYIM